MAMVIVPVGMMLGEYFRPGGEPSSAPEHWHISVGGYAEHLTNDEVKVWAAAMLEPETQARLEGTREALERTVGTRAEGAVADPAPVVDRLLDRGLLVEFDPVDGDLEAFARRHRLFPLGVGMGNTQDDPLVYRIAVGNQARIGVNGDVYALWSNSLYFLNLWESCEQFAKEMNANAPAGEHIPELDTDTVTRGLAANIPLLVSSECAFLDPIFE
ncbi:MAG: hypothetical protein J2P24_16635 [Streptosporangiales bacterium]|nr:hypothetical protein [Streptosporangiales bacterium]MBO0889740.1 hypothetical protein [Acidothermales bacterium]